MIEFIIPLNLPVRAVELTTSSANPPDWLIPEMTRWATRPEEPPKVIQEASPEPQLPQLPPPPSELEIELERLREQQDLFARACEELKQATQAVKKQLGGTLEEFQLAAIELAHAIAAKLTFDAVENDRFPIENLVHEVISRLDSHAQTVVRLNPEDLAQIQQMPQIEGRPNDPSLQFIADSTLCRGDCRAKAGEVSVVYELNHQIEEIRRQLLSTVHGHAEA